METGEVIIYQSSDGQTAIDVRLENETVWLSQAQMQELFNQTKQNISLHVRNIFKEQELEKSSVVKESLTTATDGKNYMVRYYNLDVIISVGYRIKSKRGTQFRVWANKVLKDYLVKGYTINEKKLKEKSAQLEELKQTVKVLSNVVQTQELSSGEASGLLKVIADYTYALDVLDKYDRQVLEIEATTPKELFQINYNEAMQAIHWLRDKFGGSSLWPVLSKMMGHEKEQTAQNYYRVGLREVIEGTKGVDFDKLLI